MDKQIIYFIIKISTTIWVIFILTTVIGFIITATNNDLLIKSVPWWMIPFVSAAYIALFFWPMYIILVPIISIFLFKKFIKNQKNNSIY